MNEHNLYEFFRSHWDLADEFLVDDANNRVTYGDADFQSATVAGALTTLGLKPGDRVSIQADKSVEYLWLYFGCLRGGFIFHPLNPAYTESELEYFFANAEPSVVVYDEKRCPAAGELAKQYGVKNLFTMDGTGAGSFRELRAESTPLTRVQAVNKNDPAVLLYSSGTTGKPKGIPLSHNNIAINAELLGKAWHFSAGDVLLHALPMFHAHGLFISLGCVLTTGSRMIYQSSFDPERVLDKLSEATVMMGVPTFYTRLLPQPGLNKQACTSIRLFVSGSAPLRKDTFEDFQSRTGHAIVERYGMSETIIQTTNPIDGERKAGTVGLPLPGVEVRVVNERDEVLADSEIGDIQSKSDSTFLEYWRNPEKTKEDFTSDGFLRTGDQGFFDEDGYLTIVGREKDLVICGGLNVYPAEIEQTINEFAGVEESAVIGVPHADFGEGVVAVIVARAGEDVKVDSIISLSKEKLANFKVPKAVILVDALPRNSMGKVQKNVLRETYNNVLQE
jgi:malonyl-CoA/methylmalonyl-CoA synthetase